MKRLISCLLALVLSASLAVPALATGSSSTPVEVPSTGNFWQWMANQSPGGVQVVLGLLMSGVCPVSADGKHHGYPTGRVVSGQHECKCNDCSKMFFVTDAEVDAAYQAYTEELPATGITSSGTYIFDAYDYFTGAASYGCYDVYGTNISISMVASDNLPFTARKYDSAEVSTDYTLDVSRRAILASTSCQYFVCGYSHSFSAPMSGSYRLLDSPEFSSKVLFRNGSVVEKSRNFSTSSFQYYNSGDLISYSVKIFPYLTGGPYHVYEEPFCSNGVCYLYFPRYECIPDSADFDSVYIFDSRPQFNGPVGIYDASNNLTTYEDCIIFDESSNLFTDPATGEQVEITDWTYDYTNRQYLLTTGDGNTITVTYNADQVSIVNGNVINNYYYLVDGDGSGGGDGSGDGSGGGDGSVDGSGDGGGDDGGGFFDGLLEKLVNLILKPLELLVSLVKQVLVWVLDQLTGLVDALVLKSEAIIASILSILDTIPPLFGGFYAFLGSVFGFLPPQLLAILEFGLLAYVVVGILKLIFDK